VGDLDRRQPVPQEGSKLGHFLRTLNWRPSALRNVSHHYDVGNDFYRLFLDEDLQYSCGYFADLDARSSRPSSPRRPTSPPSSGSSRA
jgi:hypothetical protein